MEKKKQTNKIEKEENQLVAEQNGGEQTKKQDKNQTKAKKKGEKKKLATWKKVVIIVSSVVLAICLALGSFSLYFYIGAKSYYDASVKAFRIPGLSQGFVPQGFDIDDEDANFLVGGYMKNGAPSPLYLVHKNSAQTVKVVTLLTEEGKPYTGHFGGVAIRGDFVYVTNETSLLVYSYSKIKNPEYTEPIPCLGKISLEYYNEKGILKDYIKTAFVSVYGDTLIAGEFYDGIGYKTHKDHKITTKSGEVNHAIAIEFKLDKSFPLGIEGSKDENGVVIPVPQKAYSLPDKVQGLCTFSNKIYLSTSFGLEFSHIYEYTKDLQLVDDDNDKKFLGTPIKVYAFDSNSLLHDYKIPPMSEGIVMVDSDELYVMSESASSKMIVGNFFGGQWCYKTKLDLMK
jgi:hypothetical protein